MADPGVSAPRPPAPGLPAAALMALSPSGQRTHIQIDAVPFVVGRQVDCNLVL